MTDCAAEIALPGSVGHVHPVLLKNPDFGSGAAQAFAVDESAAVDSDLRSRGTGVHGPDTDPHRNRQVCTFWHNCSVRLAYIGGSHTRDFC
jgi:hypothetical protein